MSNFSTCDDLSLYEGISLRIVDHEEPTWGTFSRDLDGESWEGYSTVTTEDLVGTLDEKIEEACDLLSDFDRSFRPPSRFRFDIYDDLVPLARFVEEHLDVALLSKSKLVRNFAKQLL